MARFLKIPATVTNPGAGATSWSLGVTGFTHRWDPTLLTDPVGSNILTLKDKVGTTDLTAAASGTKTLTAASLFNYLAISSGSTLGFQPTPVGAAGFTDGFTAVLVARIGAGPAIFAQVGGYAFDFGGNGKINVYNYAASTTSIATASNGTGWHTIVASFNAAGTVINVDGTDYPAASFLAPTTFKNLYLGGGTNGVDAALFATHPTVLSASDRAAVYTRVKAQLGI